MPILNLAQFIPMVQGFRIVHIDGRMGGGKTSLAFALAGELLERKFVRYCVSNIPNVWNTRPKDMKIRYDDNGNPKLDAVVIIDEAGDIMPTSRDAQRFIFGLRKLNVILLLPSFIEPSSIVRIMRIERIFNAQVVGLPAWAYKWSIKKGATRDDGYFLWWRPSEIFGIYNSAAYPLTDGGFSKRLSEIIAEVGQDEEDGYSGGAKRGGSLQRIAITENTAATDDTVYRMEEERRALEQVIEEAGQVAISLSRKRGRR